MKEDIENAFVTGCFQSETRSVFYVYDRENDPKRCYISYDATKEVHFTINNPSLGEVHFLAIDKCIFDDQGPARCDFALFTNAVFCFIEIKDVKMRGRQKARRHAKEQLLNTIEEFIQRGIIFDHQDLNAIICFVKKELYPSISAQYIDTMVEFEDRFNAHFLITNNFTF